MSSTIKGWVKFLIFLTAGLGILYFVYQRAEAAYAAECILTGDKDCDFLKKIWTDFGATKTRWILVSLGFYLMSNVLRTIRWKMLLSPLGKTPSFFKAFAILSIGYLANLGIPRSGEFLRAGMMAKYHDYDAEKVMGTIVTERIIDMMSLLVVIGLAMALSFDNFVGYFIDHGYIGGETNIGWSKYIALGMGMVLIFGLVKVFWQPIYQSRVGQKIIGIMKGFFKGLMTIREVATPFLFVLYSLGIWVCYFLMTYVMFFSFQPTSHLGPVAGLVVFVFGTLGIIIPTPGGMGTYQFLISEGLQKLYNISTGDAFSFANIMFFTVQILNIVMGILMGVLLPMVYNDDHGKKN